MTKDISMLRRKKTKNETDKSKNERKVARFVQEVQVMIKIWTEGKHQRVILNIQGAFF